MQIEDSNSNGANLSPHTRQVALVICSSANSFIELTFLLCEIYLLFRGSLSLAYSLNLAHLTDIIKPNTPILGKHLVNFLSPSYPQPSP
jgi:hypothetical protein